LPAVAEGHDGSSKRSACRPPGPSARRPCPQQSTRSGILDGGREIEAVRA
jgi:hypothetical protein